MKTLQITDETKNSFLLFLTSLLTAAVGLISTVVLARIMSISDYGTYAYTLSIATLGGVFASCGTPTVITREIARCIALNDMQSIKGMLIFSNLLVSIGVTVVGAIILVGHYEFNFYSTSEYSVCLLGSAILILYLLQLRTIVISTLNGFSKQMQQAIPALFGSLFFLLELSVIKAANLIAAPLTVILLQCLSLGIVLLLQFNQVQRLALWHKIRTSSAVFRWRKWLQESFKFLGAGVAFTINAQIDIFLLGTIRGPASVAPYQVGTKAASVLVIALGALSSVYQPLISKAYFSGDWRDVQKKVKSISRAGFISAVLFAAITVPFRNSIIGTVFGYRYLSAAPVLVVLTCARLVNASVGAVGPYLGMTEKGGTLLVVLTLESILNVAGNLVLIPRYGAIGAAFVTGISMMIVNVGAAIYIYQKFKVNTCFV